MTKKPKTYGFGFNPEETHHHFLVYIPAIKTDKNVYIFEYYEWDENRKHKKSIFDPSEDPDCRVILSKERWKSVAEEIKAEFNRYLQSDGSKTTKWKTGLTPVKRELGKELTLLAWAIEEADPTTIPYALKNWLGLSHEERWWLFTMTNAATGQAVKGRGRGWRKAVRYALTENPVTDIIHPASKRSFSLYEPGETKKKPKGKKKNNSDTKKQMTLFDVE